MEQMNLIKREAENKIKLLQNVLNSYKIKGEAHGGYGTGVGETNDSICIIKMLNLLSFYAYRRFSF